MKTITLKRSIDLCRMLTWYKTLKQELGSAKTYQCSSTDDRSIIVKHCCHINIELSVSIKE